MKQRKNQKKRVLRMNTEKRREIKLLIGLRPRLRLRGTKTD
jgi:hypothetical protein